MLKFNKFLQENESKRTRAVKRATEEANQRRVKESEIIKLEEQLASREKEEAAMRQQLQQHEKYRSFLQLVVEGEESEYHEVRRNNETRSSKPRYKMGHERMKGAVAKKRTFLAIHARSSNY